MRYFDTHAHLNLPPLLDGWQDTVADLSRRDIAVNVVGVDFSSSKMALQMAASNKNVYCSVGLHPNNVLESKEAVDQEIALLESLLQGSHSDRIVCVGETGLDLHWNKSSLAMQKYSLAKHMELAKRYKKMLNLHCRDAYQELVAMLAETGADAIIHCFTLGPAEALEYVRLGCYVSIPGVVTFKNATQLHEAVRVIPTDRLLVETDAPYLAPEPFRGKANSPFNVPLIVERIANLRGVPAASLAQQLVENSIRAFGLQKPA